MTPGGGHSLVGGCYCQDSTIPYENTVSGYCPCHTSRPLIRSANGLSRGCDGARLMVSQKAQQIADRLLFCSFCGHSKDDHIDVGGDKSRTTYARAHLLLIWHDSTRYAARGEEGCYWSAGNEDCCPCGGFKW